MQYVIMVRGERTGKGKHAVYHSTTSTSVHAQRAPSRTACTPPRHCPQSREDTSEEPNHVMPAHSRLSMIGTCTHGRRFYCLSWKILLFVIVRTGTVVERQIKLKVCGPFDCFSLIDSNYKATTGVERVTAIGGHGFHLCMHSIRIARRVIIEYSSA
jgi:hypothetical protein